MRRVDEDDTVDSESSQCLYIFCQLACVASLTRPVMSTLLDKVSSVVP